MNFQIESLKENAAQVIRNFWAQHWSGDVMIVHNHIYHPEDPGGFVALQDGSVVGLVTWVITGQACEVISLDALLTRQGIGSALLNSVEQMAKQTGCKRVWLITTNDNLSALRFYQKRGYWLKMVYPGAVDLARRLKASIPLVGLDGIPLRDEIELELELE